MSPRAQSVTTSRDTPVRFTFNAADVDGDPLTFTVPSAIPSGTLIPVAGATFEYVPNAGFIGTDSVEYGVSDGQLSATAMLTIEVTAEPFTITTSSLPDAIRRRSYTQQLEASGGTPPYTWAVTSGMLPPGLILGEGTGTITGQPTTAGTFGFTVRVTDIRGATDEASLVITVRRR